MVEGGVVCGNCGVASTDGGFQKNYADLIPLIGPLWGVLRGGGGS